MIKDIKYQGYSAVPSDYESMDGELAGSYNLVPEEGAMHPILPGQELYTLPDDYKVVFLHNMSADYKHFIVLSSDNILAWFNASEPVPPATWPITISSQDINTLHDFSSTTVYQVNAVGNTLVVLTSNGIYYFLWRNGDYVDLGNKIPDVSMGFALKTESAVQSDRIEIYIASATSDPDAPKTCKLNGVEFCNAYWMGRYFLLPYEFWEQSQTWLQCEEFQEEREKIIYSDAIKSKANSIIGAEVTGKGRFCMPFFVRYAMRLYDDSLAMHSAPVLMLPAQIRAAIDDNGDHDVNEKYGIKVYVNPCVLQYQLQQFSTSEFDKWKDIVKSVDIFISAPIWDYDQAGLASHFLSGGYQRREVASGIPQTRYAPVPSTGEGIIDYHDNSKATIPQHDRESFVKNIEECGNFYFLKSFSIEELEDMTFSNGVTDLTDLVIPDDYLQSLMVREVMSDDYQSHDTLIAKQSYNFNSRLNIASIKRKLFDGFEPWSAVCFNNAANEAADVTAYVEIYDEGRIMVVESDTRSMYFNPNGITWFYYPDSRAKRSVIKIGSTSYELPLKPHQMLNGAYYFNALTGPATTSTTPTVTTDNMVSLPNKVYTSEINNPFFFPLLGINTVGTGDILAICAAVKALSQGQFGQFPLYCFTTEGVWALETSSTGTYIARQPVTRDVCTNTDSITQLDDAVLFATDKGIMLLSGAQTQCITDAISNEFPFDIATLPGDFLDFLEQEGYDTEPLSLQPFSSFLNSCRMIYDYSHQRIIVYNSSYNYAYVYSLKDNKWGMMTTNIDYGINSYPEALAVTDAGQGGTRSVINLSHEVQYNTVDNEQVPVHVKGLIVTRPLKLDQPDVLKTVDTIIQRGKFNFLDSQRTVKPIRSILFGSRDLYNWFLVASSTDHSLRGFSGTPYKYFRIVALVDFLPDESVYGCTVQYNPRYLNRPR